MGDPPSANETVDAAHVSSKAAISNRITFFMRSLLAGEVVPKSVQADHMQTVGSSSGMFENRAISDASKLDRRNKLALASACRRNAGQIFTAGIVRSPV